MTGTVAGLRAYPVKGLAGQALDRVTLESGQGLPHDREFALARHGGAYRPGDRSTLSKRNFHMLMRDEALARYRASIGPGGVLTVARDGQTVLRTDPASAPGVAAVEDFFARVLDLPPGTTPGFVHADDLRFTDMATDSPAGMRAVSVVNLASVRDFADRVGRDVDPLRFRANVYVDGLPPFAEFDLVGRVLVAGEARLQIFHRTSRCAATTVNPVTAERDLSVPKLLMEHYGHTKMGVYATVVAGGEVRVGEAVRVVPAD